MAIILFVLKCFYFMLPAYFANMAPVIVKDILKPMAVPIDFGMKIGGKEILGKNKTLRGLFFGIIFAIVIAYFQYLLYSFDYFRGLSFIDYSNWFVVGFLFGFGALLGDMVKSFFKRRANIKPGERLVPWDQLDFVIGSLVFVNMVVSLTWDKVFYIAIISFMGHILVNHAAYYLKIRNEKW